jgi:copper chaperone CopZ
MKQVYFLLFLLSAVSLGLVNCSVEEEESTKVIHNKSCTIAIEGMMCEKGCKSTIQNKLREMDGVIHCDVDFEVAQAFITYDANITSAQEFITKINSIADGLYKAKLVEDKDIDNAPSQIENGENSESISVSLKGFEVPSFSALFHGFIF